MHLAADWPLRLLIGFLTVFFVFLPPVKPQMPLNPGWR